MKKGPRIFSLEFIFCIPGFFCLTFQWHHFTFQVKAWDNWECCCFCCCCRCYCCRFFKDAVDKVAIIDVVVAVVGIAVVIVVVIVASILYSCCFYFRHRQQIQIDRSTARTACAVVASQLYDSPQQNFGATSGRKLFGMHCPSQLEKCRPPGRGLKLLT